MTVRRSFFIFALLLAILYSLMPFLWELLTSFKSSKEILAIPPTYLPEKISFESYYKVFTLRPFLQYILNSIVVGIGTTFLTVVVGAFGAYGLTRSVLRGGELIYIALLIASIIPPIVLVVPLYEMIRMLRLINNPLALILSYTVLNLPFTVWILSSFFREIPRDIEDAARVDGFSRIGIFLRIIVPLSAPVFATTGILVFIFAWNEFLFALTFMTMDSARTVPVGIAMLSGVSVYEIPWGQISAAVVVTTLPIVLVVILFQRSIVYGLTVGAVKE